MAVWMPNESNASLNAASAGVTQHVALIPPFRTSAGGYLRAELGIVTFAHAFLSRFSCLVTSASHDNSAAAVETVGKAGGAKTRWASRAIAALGT